MNKKRFILGIDEAGRGCLAGPVFVASVLFDQKYSCQNIKDSKLLNPEKRERAYSIIKEDAIWYQYYYLSNIVIDTIGISNSIYLLMRQLYYDVKNLFPQFDITTIIDGNIDPIKEENTFSLVKADRKILSVSAASIVAKVERDRYMKNISKYFSQYSFDEHKGYGTKKHINEILNFGLSTIHRKSFCLSKKAIEYARS
ncbi:MAG TPA: ribonuclease HII [Exilispira sp.]|nr:ribonuclease HII [Exilispira sp.]